MNIDKKNIKYKTRNSSSLYGANVFCWCICCFFFISSKLPCCTYFFRKLFFVFDWVSCYIFLNNMKWWKSRTSRTTPLLSSFKENWNRAFNTVVVSILTPQFDDWKKRWLSQASPCIRIVYARGPKITILVDFFFCLFSFQHR
jgi:hypothetical protein